MLRKLWLIPVFVFGLLVSVYLSFPFDRLLERYLCSFDVSYSSLKVKKLPLEVELSGLRFKSFPVVINRLSVKPDFLSLISSEKSFNVDIKACSGKAKATFTYPLKKLAFSIKGVRLKDCVGNVPVSVGGNLAARGEFLFNPIDLAILKGSGKFSVANLQLGKLDFGLLSIERVDLGTLNGSYKVKRKNYIRISALGKGRDAELNVNGAIEINPKNFANSYVNLKLEIKLLSGKLKGKRFSFRLKGFVRNLSVK